MSGLPGNKEKMLNVALDLFSTRGFRGTSIRDIAQAMGMSISNIYHYFGNKEGLLLAILEHSAKGLVEKLRQVSEMDLEPWDRFKKLIETHLRLSENYRKEAKIFFLDEEHLSPEGAEINRQTQQEVLEIYCKELRRLEDSGYVQCRSLTVLALNILGVINWQLRWYRPEGALSLEEITGEVVSFILHGVLGGAAPDAGSASRPME